MTPRDGPLAVRSRLRGVASPGKTDTSVPPMPPPALTIWCNTPLPDSALQLLRDGTRGHKLILSQHQKVSTLTGGAPDPMLAEADVALGQPDPDLLMQSA